MESSTNRNAITHSTLHSAPSPRPLPQGGGEGKGEGAEWEKSECVRNVYIIAELRKGCITQETYELVRFARLIGKGQKPVFLLLGRNVEKQAREISQKTRCDTLVVIGDHLEHYNALSYAHTLMEILQERAASWLCLPHTSMGYDLAPRVAALLKAACITGVESVGDGFLGRPIHSGRFVEEIVPDTSRVVVTVLPGAFRAYEETTGPAGGVKVIRAAFIKVPSQTLGVVESVHRDSALKDAEVIVSGGRGIGEKENVSLIKTLAARFPRSAVGASRSACDLGWFERKQQIGTTGQTVSPKLYIACGISGAFQHVSGMRGAQTVVAINTDIHAPIFQVAHYGIVEDLETFIPLLIEATHRTPLFR
ncbi:MAG: Electron transfer flavoprotein (Etf), alpha subunit [Deltaproteobacteria bacterium]|nr:Electron transfer flavoprotein (Etf), alpha subunit [Deltaproteobacteria bacterium]